MFLEQPGKKLDLAEPKEILRVSDKTLSIDTGNELWRDHVDFQSTSDADRVKREIVKLNLLLDMGLGHRLVPPTFLTL